MSKTAAILFTLVLAMLVMPLQQPVASCIQSRAPSHEACKPNCCANKTCCAVSEKNTGTAAQPLSQDRAAKQHVIGFVAVPVMALQVLTAAAEPVFAGLPARAHSPPPLAASCIRLI